MKTVNIIRLNDEFSYEFDSTNGVKQGDNFSPTGFNCYIDGLIHEIKSLNLGATLCDGTKISILAYADDIVLIGDDEAELSSMLQILNQWCGQWRMLVNVAKTKVVHFRKKNTKETSVEFLFDGTKLEKIAP